MSTTGGLNAQRFTHRIGEITYHFVVLYVQILNVNPTSTPSAESDRGDRNSMTPLCASVAS
ncbi:MAG: hypothetical protein OEU36_24970, partial [Gammaproteobacteria bacterium]|nr:hypothetical protein [Gammaproteobacteria bacterium]